jgi:hypothetical protein
MSMSADNDLIDLVQDTNNSLDDVGDALSGNFDEEKLDAILSGETHSELGDVELSDDNDIKLNVPAGKALPKDLPVDTEVTVTASLDTKDGRSALRAKIAADALKTSPVLHDAHPKGGFTTDLDVKPTGDLAKVEDLAEQQKAMLDLAKAPPKVRKEAETIHRLVSEGKLDPKDLDSLVAEGLDKDAVAYYKKYFSQVDGGSEFASELIKEHAKAQAEANMEAYKVKMARAYELAYDMVSRGLCDSSRNSVSAQVDEIMKFNDDSFDSLKRVVARHEIKKEATGKLPQVGLDTTSTQSESNLYEQLSAALSTKPGRGSF